jgi:hypothetical protein
VTSTATDLRVSDADRDRAIAQVGEHFQAGRLTVEEFDERSGIALQAKTERELAALFTDLPQDQMPTPAPSAVSGRHRPWVPVVPIAAVVIIAAAAIGLSVSGGHAADIHVGFGGLLPVLIVLLVVRRLGWIGNRGQGPFR